MNEALRRRYLAVLGIEQWLPRDAPADVVEAAAAEATTVVAPPALHELRGMPPQLSASASMPPISPPPSSASSPAPGVSPTSLQSMPAERVGCSLLAPGEGLLLLAEFVTPDAAGLSGQEHALLINIAAALMPGISGSALPDTLDFSWPPRGARLPGMDRPGAAMEALMALLIEQRKRGVRDVLVLGETLGNLLRTTTLAQSLSLVIVPSLAAMLADPAQKRACWVIAQSLRRSGPTT